MSMVDFAKENPVLGFSFLMFDLKRFQKQEYYLKYQQRWFVHIANLNGKNEVFNERNPSIILTKFTKKVKISKIHC